MEFDDVDGITVLGLRRYGLPKTSWYVKRSFDIVGSSAGLLFLTPLLLGLSLAVRLSSPDRCCSGSRGSVAEGRASRCSSSARCTTAPTR